MLDSNYLIVNRKPYRFAEAQITDCTALFLDESGNMVEQGAIDLDESVYAALYCDEVQNVTLVINEGGRQSVVTMLWKDEGCYHKAFKELKAELSTELSKQNIKLNRYAESLAEKLSIGVELKVVDAMDSSEMVKCPECGMMNTIGSPYCLECGADL